MSEPVLGTSIAEPSGHVWGLCPGAGKTTLLLLLARLHRPTRGTISLDGVALDNIARSSLVGNVGLVTQVRRPTVGPVVEGIRDAEWTLVLLPLCCRRRTF